MPYLAFFQNTWHKQMFTVETVRDRCRNAKDIA